MNTAAAINFDSLADDELLCFVDAGMPGALEVAARRLERWVLDPYDTETFACAYEDGKEKGRDQFAQRLEETYGELLGDLQDKLAQHLSEEDDEALTGLRAALEDPGKWLS